MARVAKRRVERYIVVGRGFLDRELVGVYIGSEWFFQDEKCGCCVERKSCVTGSSKVKSSEVARQRVCILVPLLRAVHLRSVASSSSSTRHVDLASHLTRGSVRTLIQSIAMHADLETGIHMLKLTLLAIKISPGYNR